MQPIGLAELHTSCVLGKMNVGGRDLACGI